ncbi:MAG: LysM peptidoglycan-binding domain-containing protein [Bacteriovoracaceae bacterium]
MSKIIVMSILVSSLVSCSKFKRVSDKNKPAQQEEKLDELEGLEGLDDFESDDLMAEEPKEEEQKLLVEEASEQVMKPEIKKEMIASYTVQSGDTLMLISYKLYGHHREWKNIHQANKAMIGSPGNLKVGAQLSYYPPQNPVKKPEGKPYLIKLGDSLSLISGKVYGDIKLWRPIFNNNSQAIDDPNLIFAGFTIYYPEKSSHSLASY